MKKYLVYYTEKLKEDLFQFTIQLWNIVTQKRKLESIINYSSIK